LVIKAVAILVPAIIADLIIQVRPGLLSPLRELHAAKRD
jgi:hypothetical protein